MALPRGSTLPTSRRTRLLQLLLDHASGGGDGLTFAALLVAYRSKYRDASSPDSLHSPLGALLHAGEIVRTGRRDGRVVYRAVVSAVGSSVDDSLERELSTMTRQASRVVADLYREHRVPIPTAWISAELKRRKLWPDRFQRLTLVLSRLQESSAVHTGAGTLGVRRVVSRSFAGSSKVAWVPAGVRGSPASVPPGEADALRHAISAAAEAAGRPVSRKELRWWLMAHSRDIRLTRSLGKRLKNLAYRDSGRTFGSGSRMVAGPLSCHGGTPVRYYLGSLDRLQRDACRITDASATLRVAQEDGGIMAARHQLPIECDPVRRLISLRAALLNHAWHAHAGTEPEEALALARRAATTTAAWAAEGPRSDGVRQGRARDAARSLADVDACEHLLGRRHEQAWNERRPRGVGEAATVSLGALREFADVLTKAGELRLVRAEAAYADARRFPFGRAGACTGPPAVGLHPGDTLAVVDRVDALLGIVRHVKAHHAVGLITAAAALLGHVLRDAAVVNDVLDRLHCETTNSHAHERRKAIIVLGMLGVVVEHERAFPRQPEEADLTAYLVSVLCSAWQAEGALARLDAVAQRLPVSLRPRLLVTDRALRSGRYFSAIDSEWVP